VSNLEREEQSDVRLQVAVSPEPTDEELLAIMQALRALEQEDSRGIESRRPETNWGEIGRKEDLRARNWPLQVRNWSDRRY
jgi:hypothetical protein